MQREGCVAVAVYSFLEGGKIRRFINILDVYRRYIVLQVGGSIELITSTNNE